MLRQICRPLLVLALSLLVAAPTGGPAHATKAHPWSAYFPAKGVTCTSTVTHADGKTERRETTVLAKSAKKVVTRTTGEGRTTSTLLPGGRLQTTKKVSARAAGIRVRVSLIANYPSPTKLLHRRSGSGKVTMAMTLPKRMADEALKSGRTLTITGNYRLSGLGSRSITLADPAATKVEAVGVRATLRSLKISNATAAFARWLKKEMRTQLAALGGTSWIARGRGTVQLEATDIDGAALTVTQVGCT